MTLEQIIKDLDLNVITEKKDFSGITPTHGYVSDMLSCVMTGAKNKSIWVTLQAHNNIVAVACLLDIAAVIISEGAKPDEDTIKKANEEGITLLSTDKNSFSVVGRLWQLGLRDQERANPWPAHKKTSSYIEQNFIFTQFCPPARLWK